jgi:hypothetical protein
MCECWILTIIAGCICVRHQIHIIGKKVVLLRTAYSVQRTAFSLTIAPAHIIHDGTVIALLTLVSGYIEDHRETTTPSAKPPFPCKKRCEPLQTPRSDDLLSTRLFSHKKEEKRRRRETLPCLTKLLSLPHTVHPVHPSTRPIHMHPT